MKKLVIAGLSTALLGITASHVSASPITIPPSLAPGSTYFLVFVTADTTNAQSSDITTYDAFVTAEANMSPELAALGTTWRVIGSTESVNAVTHDAITGPVFRLDGTQIASGSADLFDGSIAAPLNINQFGSAVGRINVWTGSQPNGTKSSTKALGDIAPWYAFSDLTNSFWIQEGAENRDGEESVYAVSGPLVVPAATVPEPATLTLMIGPALLLLRRRRRGTSRPWSEASFPRNYSADC